MKAISRWIELFENVFFTVAIFSSVVLSATGVFFRYVLNDSLGFVEEVAGFLLLLVVTVGIGAAVRRGKHLRVDALIQFFPRTRKYLDIYADVLALGVMTALFICAIEFVYQLWEGDQRTTTMWWLPVYMPLIIMPVGYATALFRLVENLRKLIKTPGDVEKAGRQARAL
jgi:C4-dicarboxylate transporter DctQ subunit